MTSNSAGPQKIGRYQILGELGRGAMGRVYRAFDPNIGRNIAVKVIPLDTADPELATRFRREAQAAGILSHPNIVTIFDAGDDGGFLYIAMELVEGQTLQQMLSSGPLPVEQVISFCEQAGAALDHAHARAIIHRDIKPANIMV
ncbi:MAG: serine/threonine protein kinase, partial [Acidobacteria bacterium]|nr:serine/threonine protein kinase [Acidobacteriota bacterium]